MRARRRTQRRTHRIAAIVLASFVLAGQAHAGLFNEPQRWGAAALDIVVLTPLWVARTGVGFGLFIPAAIVSAPSGRPAIRDAWDLFVTEPFDEAFKRPLGDF